MVKSAIILCSGGLDSVVTSHFVKTLGYDKIRILFFDYGQKSIEMERKFSEKCAGDLGADFNEIKLDFLQEISTSLINVEGKANELSRKDLKDTKEESSKWYVPCRNLIFLSYALAFAESIFVKEGIKNDIFVGFKCEGKEGYLDQSKEFVKSINEISKFGCEGKFEIKAPLIEKDKEDIVKLGEKLGVDFCKTFSCYVGSENHCGKCLACKLRQEGFYWSGIKDPTDYS